MDIESFELEPIKRLTRDLKRAAVTLSPKEARYLVDIYYQVQEYRKRAANQVSAMNEEPHEVIAWAFGNFETLENQIKRALDAYTDSESMGRWSKSVHGIGPVLSAGLLAHIEIEKAPTVGHIWRFAGLDPSMAWEKSQKRPWNARLKVVCWKIGESFVKVSNSPKDFYGHLYRQRKELEQQNNDAGLYADQAADKLKKYKIGKDTVAYTYYIKGMLPPDHINERAKRWAVKLFLAHWHAEAYRQHYGVEPPKPYPLAILGHGHEIKPPA